MPLRSQCERALQQSHKRFFNFAESRRLQRAVYCGQMSCEVSPFFDICIL